MKKIIDIVAGLTLLCAFILTVLFGYWYLYPYKPLVFKDPVFPVITKTVKPGGSVFYISNYCKILDQEPVVSRSFVDEIIFTTPLTTTDRPLGCHSLVFSATVPPEIPPGVYHLENTYTFQVNPIRSIVVSENTENFTVIK